VDYSGKIPIQSVTINDALPRGNGNGVLDIGDLGSQVARTSAQRQQQEVKEIRFDASYDLDDNGSRFDFGVDYRTSKMIPDQHQHPAGPGQLGHLEPARRAAVRRQPGQAVLPGLPVRRLRSKQSGAGLMSFRADAVDLYNALSPVYVARGNAVGVTSQDNNRSTRTSGRLRPADLEGRAGGRDASMVAGVRYEKPRPSRSR
jgi:hypothetical protein